MVFCPPKTKWIFARLALDAGLIIVTTIMLSTFVAVPQAAAQVAPKATDGPPKPKGTSTVRRGPRVPRSTNPPGSTPAVVTESDRFLQLGDRFREKERWNAAEAAYKEAVNIWSRNAEALAELGYIYLNSNRVQEAQATASKLQGVNPQYARELQADIAKHKAQR